MAQVGMCEEIGKEGPRLRLEVVEIGVKGKVVLPVEARDAEQDLAETPKLGDGIDHHIDID